MKWTVQDLHAAYLRVLRSSASSASSAVQHRNEKRIRFPGIVALADELAVSRIHLYYVLTGVRHSPRIQAHPSVRALLRKERAA
jgi:hypothetical protein